MGRMYVLSRARMYSKPAQGRVVVDGHVLDSRAAACAFTGRQYSDWRVGCLP